MASLQTVTRFRAGTATVTLVQAIQIWDGSASEPERPDNPLIHYEHSWYALDALNPLS